MSVKIAEYKFNSSIDTLFSEVNDGFVYTHTDIDNGDGTITRTIYSDQLPTIIRFEDCEGLLELLYLNTSELTSLRKTFKNCYNVTSINATDWNTSKVTSFYEAFEDCNNLITLDVSNWDTSNVTDMKGMFDDCNNLTELNVSNFNTSNVTNMHMMFYNCVSLTQLDLSNWETGNVTSMAGMFYYCQSLTSLNVSNFNTSNVTDMNSVFSNCKKLTSLDVSNFDTSKLTNMAGMFRDCTKLETITGLNNFDVSKVTHMNMMFHNSPLITSLDLSSWNTDSLVYITNDNEDGGMFSYCTNLHSITFGEGWNTSQVTNMKYMFNKCRLLTSLDVSNFDTSNVTDMKYMFNKCRLLTSLDVSNFDTSNVTNMTEMINECYDLTELNISNWHLNSEVDVTDMFTDTNVLTNVIMNNSDYASVNKVITQLPTRTSDSMGTLDIVGVDDKSQVDVTTAQSKYWNITNLIKIVEYKFDNTIADLVPIFNEAFTDYNIVDQVNNNIITRCIYNINNINNNINVIDNISKVYDNQSVRTPLILDNGNIEFVCSPWDVAKIDLSEYAGKTANISFTIETKVNTWCEFGILQPLYETVISQQTGDTIETINYTKTLSISENMILHLEGMNVTLSDILITIDNVNIFPNKLIDEPCLINEVNKNFYCVPPYYENNKLYFTHDWDGLFIDLQDYIGRDINIKFDVFGIKNDHGWTEFQYGSAVNGDRVELIENGLYCTTLNESTELQHFDFNLNVYNKYLYFGGTGLLINNLSIEVINNDKITLEKVNLTNIREYQEPYYKSNGDIYFNESDWDTYSVNVADYIGKTMNVSFQIESFDDGTYGHWLEAYSTGYSDAHIYETCTEKRTINVDYNYTINNELFILQGSCIKMKNVQLIVDGVNLYETLAGFDSFNDDNYHENFKLAKKMDNGELWFTYSQWNVVGYDLSKYINGDITVSFDIVVSTDSWWSEAYTHIIYSDSYSDSKVFGDTLVCEDPAENKTIHFERTYQLNVDEEQAVFILEGMGINIKNLSIKAVNIELPTKIRFGTGTHESTDFDGREKALLEVLYLDNRNLRTEEQMFQMCNNLTKVDGFVNNTMHRMNHMFTACYDLTTLDVSNWDTSNVQYIQYMFYDCSNLTTLDVSNWDTSNVTDMNCIFADCHNLSALDLTNWDTSNMTDFTWLFTRCYNLTSIGNISKWDTSNVDCFDSMFFECNDLSELDLSSWDTSNITDMGYMFYGCTSLNKLNISNWDTNSVTYIDNMFEEAAINEVIMNISDYNSVNKIISKLPTRTTLGYMYVSRDILNDTNVSEAESKMWRILPLGGRVKNVYMNGNNITNMITKQNKKIKGIYLGDTPLL